MQKQDESCINNGSLSFTTTGTDPLANILFTVYKYPNLTVPVSVLGTTFLGGLGAGQYKVRAAQILNALSNTKEQDITIDHISIPFAYSITTSNQNCSQGAQITITATSGTATAFEIISGPEMRPLQTSNVFSALQAGTYNIKAYDSCGEGLVTTFTISITNATLTISEPVIEQAHVPDCSVISVTNTVSSFTGTSINYPLTVQYTIHPPDGSLDIIINDVITSGNAESLDFQQTISTYGNSPFTYDFKVIDNCNTPYQRNGQLVDPNPIVDYSAIPNPCGKKYMEVSVTNFVGPYQISIVNPPSGFDPAQFNTQHPGPFNESLITYGGETNVLPEGQYDIRIVDACGRTGQVIADIIYDVKQAEGNARNNGCFSLLGRITVSVPDTDIVHARVLIAPPEYENPTPHIVTASIINGRLILSNVPIGGYSIEVTDECGVVHIVPVTVPPFVERNFTASAQPDCGSGNSAVRFLSRNGRLTEASVILAPTTFGQNLPYDVTTSISTSSGELNLDNLPAGDYTFKGKDACGIEKTVDITITGLLEDISPYDFIPNCSSFDINMNDASPLGSSKYWLQKKNTAGIWSNPVTGDAYVEGTLPTSATARELPNNDFTHNLTLSGEFRILRSFESLSTGGADKLCLKVMGEFSYSMDLQISKAYNLACTGHPEDVLVVAENGLQPYTYSILEKDTQPFIFDNGNSNIFTGLQPGIYKFEVHDACSSSQQILLNISALPALVDAGNPDDLVLCGNGQTTNQPFNLSARDPQILNGQSPDLYTVSYHLSQDEADDDLNSLPDTYHNLANNQPIYARVIHNSIPICHEVVTFNLKVSTPPVLVVPTQYYICGTNGTATLEANAGHEAYAWSTGETTQSITVNTTGVYSITVSENGCDARADITVTLSDAPRITEIKTVDWTVDNNTITVITNGSGNYVYALNDGPFQQSNVFEGLPVGMYKITVKDEYGCGQIDEDVVLLNYPKFFTPNGDGENERWRIKFAMHEPGLQVYIYDRFGKLITGFPNTDEGWDGTLNGRPLPSTDYWFVVERGSGIVYKGHFSLIR